MAELIGGESWLIGPNLVPLLEGALALVEADSLRAARLLARLGAAHGKQGALSKSRAAFDEALDLVSRLGEPRDEFDVRRLEAAALTVAADARALGATARAAQLAEQYGSEWEVGRTHAHAALAAANQGTLDEAARHLDAARDHAVRTGRVDDLLEVAFHSANLHAQRGAWADASQSIEEAQRLFTDDAYILTTAAEVAMELGDESRLEPLLTRFRDIASGPDAEPRVWGFAARVWSWRARLGGGDDDVEFAEQLAKRQLAEASTALHRQIAETALARCALLRSDERGVNEAIVRLRGRDEAMRGLHYSADLLGQLLTFVGAFDEAAEAFERAIAFQRPDRRPGLAWSLYEYAVCLRQRDGEGDSEHAALLAREALAIAQSLEMQPLVARIVGLRAELQGVTHITGSIDLVAASIAAERPDLSPQAAPDGTVTLLFSDIENSTARTAELGDAKWMELLREHNAIVRDQLAAHGGYEVKSMGDGFMLAFGSALDGLRCAIGMQRAFATRNASAAESVRVRIGLHTGEAIKEADDFFGSHVNLAARVGGAATGDEILVSGLLKALTESAGEFKFDAGREVDLKGISGAQRVYVVEWR